MIQSLADEGIAILMISSELPEIVNLCTRVLVMYEGQNNCGYKGKRADKSKLILCIMQLEV